MNSVSSLTFPFNPILEDFLEVEDLFYPDIPLDHRQDSLETLPTITPTQSPTEQPDNSQENDGKARRLSREEIRREKNRLSAQKSRERKQHELHRLERIDILLNEFVDNLINITPTNPKVISDLKKLKDLCKTDKVLTLKTLITLFLKAIKGE